MEGQASIGRNTARHKNKTGRKQGYGGRYLLFFGINKHSHLVLFRAVPFTRGQPANRFAVWVFFAVLRKLKLGSADCWTFGTQGRGVRSLRLSVTLGVGLSIRVVVIRGVGGI